MKTSILTKINKFSTYKFKSFEDNNELNQTALHYALQNNKLKNIYLNLNEIKYLIQNSKLDKPDNYGHTPLMYILEKNLSENLNIDNKTLFSLLKNSNPNDCNTLNDYSTAMYLFQNNKSQNLNLTQKQFLQLLPKIDFQYNNQYNLIYLLIYNQPQNINFSFDKLFELIENNIVPKSQSNILSLIVHYNTKNHFTAEQIISIGKKSNINQLDESSYNLYQQILSNYQKTQLELQLTQPFIKSNKTKI